jgi:hypothetical protein
MSGSKSTRAPFGWRDKAVRCHHRDRDDRARRHRNQRSDSEPSSLRPPAEISRAHCSIADVLQRYPRVPLWDGFFLRLDMRLLISPNL